MLRGVRVAGYGGDKSNNWELKNISSSRGGVGIRSSRGCVGIRSSNGCAGIRSSSERGYSKFK